MAVRSRRTVFYLALVIVTTLVFTGAYNLGMAVWEGRPQPLYRSLEVVIQSFTTTGYGEDAPWTTLQMNLLAVVMQLAGIGLILTAVDVFAVPWLRGALTPSAPEALRDHANHVIVCGHTPRTEAFIDELVARDRDYVLVEPDAEAAADLHEAGYSVIHGDPESTEVLENAALSSALAVVADIADDTNASIVLSAHDADPDVRVITLVENASLARYHRAAGAAAVLSPRQLLGESLATEVPTAVSTVVDEGVTIAEDFELVELSVQPGSDLGGQTFAEAGLRDRFGVNVLGAWYGGDFVTPVEPTHEIEPGARLLVAGETAGVASLAEATASVIHALTPQEIVLAGYGDSGQAAYRPLAETGSNLTVVDIESKPAVDHVGDARDPAVLREAGIGEASAILLTLADDTTAIFATLIARDLNPDIRIVVRANQEENVQQLYRAGADYVQSLATVSGRMLASTVLEAEEALAYDKQVSIVQLPAAGLAERTLASAGVRTRTGCTVVAVIRDDEALTEIDPDTFEFAAHDEVVVAGTDEDIARFDRQFRS